MSSAGEGHPAARRPARRRKPFSDATNAGAVQSGLQPCGDVQRMLKFAPAQSAVPEPRSPTVTGARYQELAALGQLGTTTWRGQPASCCGNASYDGNDDDDGDIADGDDDNDTTNPLFQRGHERTTPTITRAHRGMKRPHSILRSHGEAFHRGDSVLRSLTAITYEKIRELGCAQLDVVAAVTERDPRVQRLMRARGSISLPQRSFAGARSPCKARRTNASVVRALIHDGVTILLAAGVAMRLGDGRILWINRPGSPPELVAALHSVSAKALAVKRKADIFRELRQQVSVLERLLLRNNVAERSGHALPEAERLHFPFMIVSMDPACASAVADADDSEERTSVKITLGAPFAVLDDRAVLSHLQHP